MQDAPGRVAILRADELGKAGARADGIVDHIFGHEGAAPLLDANQATGAQRIQRAPHGVAIHSMSGGEFRFGWQAGTWGMLAAGDRLFQGLRDLPPQGDTLPSGKGAGIGERWECHESFNPLSSGYCHIRH
ncbi:hypothetical protein HMPREF9946_01207 [Acetobacteraceae bacterium AT-5844]|nr:hypothetical protein HMPREF9946_01207 [Acetobacteraceae bacterium AT-5844]